MFVEGALMLSWLQPCGQLRAERDRGKQRRIKESENNGEEYREAKRIERILEE